MKNVMQKFRRLKVNCARITIRDKDLVPEEERITKVKFTRSIEQMRDPTILDTYLYSNTRGFIRQPTIRTLPLSSKDETRSSRKGFL